MATLDGMDGMDGMGAMARGAPATAAGEFAVMVEQTRAATVNLAWLAHHGNGSEHLLTPRGVVDGKLPSPGELLTPQHHDARVRATLYDFELQSALLFEADGHETAHLKYRLPAGAAAPLMQITRPTLGIFREQALHVEQMAQLRSERFNEILPEITPQFPLWTAVANLSAERTPRTLELIDCGLRLTSSVVQQFKHQFVCPRPNEYSPLIQPIIQTPAHRSYPSGHATQAFFVARLLQLLAGPRCPPAMAQQLQAQAARIAQNREVAGVHFPADSLAGRLLGDTLAHHMAHVGSAGRLPRLSCRFDACENYDFRANVSIDRRPELRYELFQQPDESGARPGKGRGAPAPAAAPRSRPAVAWLWEQAAAEWQP
jgi:hypothetical protein